VTYRWDFGDGSAIAGPFSTNVSSHTYAICGEYTVRVEATDSYGQRAIGTLKVKIDEACTWRIFMPIVVR
jgi:hypothetical protein